MPSRMDPLVAGLWLGLFCSTSAGCALFGDKEPLDTSGTIAENVLSSSAEGIAIDHSSRNVARRMNDGSEVARPGEVPAGLVARTTFVTSTVRALDKKVPSVTLESSPGGA